MSAPLVRGLDALPAGERFRTRARTITEADVTLFASLSGDLHPQHTDAAWAARSRFGGRIAHGMLVLSCALGLVPLDPERVVALRRVGDAVFKHPVHLGDTIHVEGRVACIDPVDSEHALMATRWRVVNHRGGTVASAHVELLIRRAVAAAHAPASEADESPTRPRPKPEPPSLQPEPRAPQSEPRGLQPDPRALQPDPRALQPDPRGPRSGRA